MKEVCSQNAKKRFLCLLFSRTSAYFGVPFEKRRKKQVSPSTELASSERIKYQRGIQ